MIKASLASSSFAVACAIARAFFLYFIFIVAFGAMFFFFIFDKSYKMRILNAAVFVEVSRIPM